MADLPLTARRGLTASFRTFDLPLADVREDGAEVLVLDDRGLRNLPQLVKGGVRQVEPAVADRQPAVGIIDDGDALAAEFAGDLVRLQQETTLSYCRVKLLETVRSSRQAKTSARLSSADNGSMEVLGVVRLLAEAGVVIGQETRQQFIAGGDRTDPLKTQSP